MHSKWTKEHVVFCWFFFFLPAAHCYKQPWQMIKQCIKKEIKKISEIMWSTKDCMSGEEHQFANPSFWFLKGIFWRFETSAACFRRSSVEQGTQAPAGSISRLCCWITVKNSIATAALSHLLKESLRWHHQCNPPSLVIVSWTQNGGRKTHWPWWILAEIEIN